MGLKVDLMPPSPRSIWEAIKKLQRDVQELRAARTLEASAIGDGGLTIQSGSDGTGRRIVIAPQGALSALLPSGDTWYPPGLMFYSGDPAEVTPGEITAYLSPDEVYPVPIWTATTVDVGNGVSQITMQGGTPAAAAITVVSAGADYMRIGDGAAEFVFSGGTSIALGTAGAQFLSEGPIALTLNNGWTATGGTWALPNLLHTIDNSMILQGSITPGTLTAGTTLVTLPVGYAPTGDLEFRVPGGSATAYCDLVVHAGTGLITITNVAGTITRLSLSTIRWSMSL